MFLESTVYIVNKEHNADPNKKNYSNFSTVLMYTLDQLIDTSK